MAEPQRKPAPDPLSGRMVYLEYLDENRVIITTEKKDYLIELLTEQTVRDFFDKTTIRLDIAYGISGISLFIAVAVLASR